MDEKGGNHTPIYIWNINNLQEYEMKLTSFHKNKVKLLRFSPNGKFILSVGNDINQTILL